MNPIAFNWQAGTTDDPSPQTNFTPPLRRNQVPAVAFSCKDHGADASEELAPTLRSMTHDGSHANGGGQLAVAFAQNQRDEVRQMDIARNGRGSPADVVPPLKAQSGETGKGDAAPLMFDAMQVRRLTPVECERLQGFPDNYTLVPHRGKPAADGPRYKALGNSMAVPVITWLGQRIQMVQMLTDKSGEVQK